MPEAVVDALDVVQVNQCHGQDGPRFVVRRASGQVVRQAIEE